MSTRGPPRHTHLPKMIPSSDPHPRYEYLRPTSCPLSFIDLIRLLRVKGRGDKRQAKLLVLLLRVKNSMFRAARAEKKRKGVRGTYLVDCWTSAWFFATPMFLHLVKWVGIEIGRICSEHQTKGNRVTSVPVSLLPPAWCRPRAINLETRSSRSRVSPLVSCLFSERWLEHQPSAKILNVKFWLG